jgi:hypothetical protein
MKCPQCGADNADDAWNCISCRINLYWAVQHFEALAQIREQQGLSAGASSAAFLVKAHEHATAERADNAIPESKVRSAARQIIRRKSVDMDSSTRG